MKKLFRKLKRIITGDFWVVYPLVSEKKFAVMNFGTKLMYLVRNREIAEGMCEAWNNPKE